MTLNLIVTRHAKSSWDDLTLEDFERPLNARGRASAVAIGKWLEAQGHRPAAVLHSSAVRTTETWDRVSTCLASPASVTGLDTLYLASGDQILNALGKQQGETIMLIGHNPGIGDFAHRIIATAPDHPRFRDYPTAATLVCSIDANSWADVRWGTGHPLEFVVPRDLIEP